MGRCIQRLDERSPDSSAALERFSRFGSFKLGSFKKGYQATLQSVGVLGLTLPHGCNFPTCAFQRCYGSIVTRPIRSKFVFPKFPTGLGCRGPFTSLVPVPKTSVDEYHLATAPKHDVGSARKICGLKPVSVTSPMKETAHDQLRAGIPSSNPPH